jgi:mannose-6-phosphate isomerase-like protein (cupin superfamily)
MTQATPTQLYHGGAHKIPLRWANVAGTPIQRASFYMIPPGQVCTRHVHTGKTETWVVVAGRGVATVGDVDYPLGQGDAVETVAGTSHKLTNNGIEALYFMNLSILTGGPVTTTELPD